MDKHSPQSDWLPIRTPGVSVPLLPHPTDGRTVADGDRVSTGERVGRSAGSSCLVPVNGVVVADGRTDRLSIDVDADFELPPEPVHHHHHDRDAIAARLETVRHADRGVWFDRIRSAGILVDRHGCPQLQEQLRQVLTRPIDAVVCTALDAESSLPFVSKLAARFATEMMIGTALLGRAIGAPTVITAIDASIGQRQMAAARHWGTRAGIRVARLVNRYPQCDPTLVLYTLLDRRLRPGRLPTDQGVLLIDAPTAIAIGHLLITDTPMTSVFIAVRDVMTRRIVRARVPVGTPASTLMRALGLSCTNLTVRAGELLRDERVMSDVPVGFGELTFHAAPLEPSIIPDPCVRCGWCVEICPTRVHPAGLLDAAQRHDPDMADRHGLHACIECGLCTYVCPSKLPLLATIRELKTSR